MPLERKHCPACENVAVAELVSAPYTTGSLDRYRKGFKFKNFTLLECSCCGLIFQREVLTDEEAASYYTRPVKTIEESDPPLRTLAHFAEDAMQIRMLFPGKPRVLDFGTGAGHWARIANAFGCQTWGCDVGETAALRTAERGVPFMPIFTLPENHFEFINADQVFEHLSWPRKTLNQLTRALRSGGIIKISTPGNVRLKRTLKRFSALIDCPAEFEHELNAIAPLEHVQLFSEKSLKTMAASVSLKSFRVPLKVGYGSMLLFDSGKQLNRNLYNPIKRWRATGCWQYFRKP